MTVPTLTRRGYEMDGLVFVRVTAVCSLLRKPFLEQWRGKVGNVEADKIMRDSAAFGTKLHEALHAFATGGAADEWLAALPPDLGPFGSAFMAWWRVNVQAVLGAERTLVSRQYGFAGTADLIAVLADGQTAIVDWKSSKAFPA